MNTQNMLDLTLAEILCNITPLREDLDARMRILGTLRGVVSSVESLKGASVEPFGSFLSQLFSRWGDLDISIELSNGTHILLPAKKHKHVLLEDLLKALRTTGCFRRLQFVSHARVPILKLESKIWNISCDISINNLSGYMKSKFLLWISLIDPRFRDVVLLVKEWAKANGINNPRTGTFNSYSLSLLVVFHFQTCAPAMLPPLQDFYPGNMTDELIGVRADVERRIEEIALSNIERFRKHRRVNHSSLSHLFLSFLGKFLDIGTRTTEQGISTYSGRWEYINTNTRWLPKTYSIFIEDPFEQPQNTARAVTQPKVTRIAEAFRNTYYLLMDPTQSHNTLLPSLARHEIFHLFPGAAFVNPRADVSLSPWPNHNARYSTYSSSLFQHQFQSMRQVNDPRISKVQTGEKLSRGGQERTSNQQLSREKPRGRGKNSDKQKKAQQRQNGQQLSLGRRVRATNQQLPREKSESQDPQNIAQEGQNGEQLSLGRQVRATNQQLRREKPGRVRATNQQLPREKSETQDPQNIAQEGQNGARLSLGRQVRATNQQLPREKPGSLSQNADRQKTAQQGQKGKQVSRGRQGRGTNQQFLRGKPGSQGQNAGRQKITQQGSHGKKLSRGRQLPATNQQLPREKPGSQVQTVDQEKTAQQSQGQIPPASSPIVSPPWPHTLQPKPKTNNVV